MLSAAGTRPSVAEDGFALVELLVVLAIGALLISLAVTQRPDSRNRLEIRAVAQTIVSDFARARLAAVNRATVQRVEFDTSQKSYKSTVDGRSQMLPHGILMLPGESGASSRRSGSYVVSFFPDGTVSSSVLFLKKDGKEIVISLNWLTGHATTQE